MSRKHFYSDLPDHNFWSRAVSRVAPGDLNPVTDFPFKINPEDKVATAGSCFAQHIARHLKASGFTYFVTEPAHPLTDLVDGLAERMNYGTFSARFGNVYTTRQLVQLFDRAHGHFHPAEPDWQDKGGNWCDPFRPAIQPGGFATRAELIRDRDQHLAQVRYMFEELNIFVFTLGLTECWTSRADGAVFPLCPGVKAGHFDPGAYAFVNLGVDEVVTDLNGFLDRLARVNPKARVIFTVSPVPLAATAEDRHVMISTTVSKSILRVACDVIERAHDHVAYFPSYEIVTSAVNGPDYFAPDRRNVTEAGVNHAMRMFFAAATDRPTPAVPPAPATGATMDRLQTIVDVICDEEALDRPNPT
ncbi:GSCFA domain-containing protein [Aliiroseovarius subalbicans]|uniref:GSCFA domain-containing protein n=1 Tax=Aliiroseovarius subalbicans TaxID=2925840 RepID=UPI001F5741DE|nr:GSCFA domain-containing protein [Aliiroseovarius subalbicans]MCI2399517.1 GSCFA domain-containing protein [Aliiroseovarius subalbicans]